MNVYRISYTIGGPQTESTDLIERNEAAARKMFKVFCKSGTITNIELFHTGVSASKQQERDTLAAIMQMVEELGPNSYLATAFSGCFDIAEWNIENDGADSFKELLEIANQKMKQATEENKQVKQQYEEAFHEHRVLEAEKDALKDKLALASQQLKEKDEFIKNATNAREDAQIFALEAEADRRAAEETVTQLKAKLYDYMSREV